MKSKFFLILSLVVLGPFFQIANSTPAWVKGKKINDSCNKFLLSISDEVQNQRDEFYGLMAYAVVFKNWQTKVTRPLRGYNIGGILVDPLGEVVWWERNSGKFECSGTHHGETRMIWSYLKATQTKKLKCHTIYSTLEPCAMCSGMMTLTQLMRTVYGHEDIPFGRALERLQMAIAPTNKGYPRAVASAITPGNPKYVKENYPKQLEEGTDKFIGGNITDFLFSNQAKAIFEKATNEFLKYGDIHEVLPENKELFSHAQEYFEREVTDFPMDLDGHILFAKTKKRPRLRPFNSCQKGTWDTKKAVKFR